MITYTAGSLEDIALLFDQNSQRCFEQAGRMTRVYGRKEREAEGRTWRNAADILRKTTMKEKDNG